MLELSYRNKNNYEIPEFILDFCFILVASNTVIWASLFDTHKFKLEAEDFIFHVAVFSRHTFQTLV